MKNEKLFWKAVDILVKAYQNDTLEYKDCAACAVGNLVLANMGYDYYCFNSWKNKQGEIITPQWDWAINLGKGELSKRVVDINTILEIESTGYSALELAKIERAFCTGTSGFSSTDKNFSGLMAVVDTLMQIHEANDKETADAKSLFVKV